MGLITELKVKSIDISAISKGCLIFVEGKLWNNPKRGIVTRVTESSIEFEFLVDNTNVMNRCLLTAENIENFTIRWTENMETIHNYPEVTTNDIGRTD